MPFIMITVCLGLVFMIVVVVALLSHVVEQGHARHLSQGQRMGVLCKRLCHETFQLGADPHHQIGVIDAANIGGAQGKVMGRSAGRQQYPGLTHAIGDGGRDKAKGFDGGQHLEGAGRQTHRQQGSDQCKNSHRYLVRK